MSRLIILLFLSSITTAQICHRLYRKDQFSITQPDKVVKLDLLKEYEYDPNSCNGYELYSGDKSSQRVGLVLAYILSKQGIPGLKKVSTSPRKHNIRVSDFKYLYTADYVYTDRNNNPTGSELNCTRLGNIVIKSPFMFTVSGLKTIRKPGSVEVEGRVITLQTDDIRPFLDVEILNSTGDGDAHLIGLDGMNDQDFNNLLAELQVVFNMRQVNPENSIRLGQTFHYRGRVPLAHPVVLQMSTQYHHCKSKRKVCLDGDCGTTESLPFIMRGPDPTTGWKYPCSGTRYVCAGDSLHPFFTKITGTPVGGKLKGYNVDRFLVHDSNTYKPWWFLSGSVNQKLCTDLGYKQCDAPYHSQNCGMVVKNMKLVSCLKNNNGYVSQQSYRSVIAPYSYQNDQYLYQKVGAADPGFFGLSLDHFRSAQNGGEVFSERYDRNATFEFDQCNKFGFKLIGITKRGMFYSNYSLSSMKRCAAGLPPLNLHIGRIRRSISLENGSHVGNTTLTCNNKYNYVCTVHLTCPKTIDTAQVSETVEVSTTGCVDTLKTYFGPYVWVAISLAIIGFILGVPAIILVIKNRKIIKYC